MRIVAIGMLVAGALGLLWAYNMEISVPVIGPFRGFSAERVINFSLAARQTQLTSVSAVIFLAGVILFAARQVGSHEESSSAASSRFLPTLREVLKSAVIEVMNEFSRMNFGQKLVALVLSTSLLLFFSFLHPIIGIAVSYGAFVLYAKFIAWPIADTNRAAKKTGKTSSDRTAILFLAIILIVGVVVSFRFGLFG